MDFEPIKLDERRHFNELTVEVAGDIILEMENGLPVIFYSVQPGRVLTLDGVRVLASAPFSPKMVGSRESCDLLIKHTTASGIKVRLAPVEVKDEKPKTKRAKKG